MPEPEKALFRTVPREVELYRWDGSEETLELLRHEGADPDLCDDGQSVNVFEAVGDDEICLAPGDWFLVIDGGIERVSAADLETEYEPTTAETVADEPGVTWWVKKRLRVALIRWDGSSEALRLIQRHEHAPPGGCAAVLGTSLNIWVAKSRAVMSLNLGDWAALERDGTGIHPLTDAERESSYDPLHGMTPLSGESVDTPERILARLNELSPGYVTLRQDDIAALLSMACSSPEGSPTTPGEDGVFNRVTAAMKAGK